MRAICAGLLLAAGAVQAATGQAGGLQARDLNGDGTVDAYYDPGQNVSFTADADLAGTQGVYVDPGIPGALWRSVAVDWVQGLNFYGVTGWRLPVATSFACDLDGVSCKPATSEISSLGSFAVFSNVKDCYWLSSLSPAGSVTQGQFTYFAVAGLYHGTTDEGSAELFAWAVHDGDVGSTMSSPEQVREVPEPSTWLLLLIGLTATPLRFWSRS